MFADEDTEEIAQEIRSEISQIKNDLPEDINDPIVKDVKGESKQQTSIILEDTVFVRNVLGLWGVRNEG